MNAQRIVKNQSAESRNPGTSTQRRGSRGAGDGTEVYTGSAVARPRLSGTCSSEPSAGGDAAARHWIHVGGERRVAGGSWQLAPPAERRGWGGTRGEAGCCGRARDPGGVVRGAQATGRCDAAAAPRGPLAGAPGGSVVGLFCQVAGLLSRRF